MLRQEEDENETTRQRKNQDTVYAGIFGGCRSFSAHAGGGKAIDTCKVLAHSTNRPFFTFPTIASTCASCTSLGIDVRVYPYTVTEQMIVDGIMELEAYDEKIR